MSYRTFDSDHYAEQGIEAFFFPGGEPHVKIPQIDGDYLVVLKLRTWKDVGLAACLLEALTEQEHLIRRAGEVTRKIFIPYFPAGRQDRSDGCSPLTLKIMALLLARGDVVLFDPHSEQTAKWIRKAGVVLTRQQLNVRTFMPSNLDLTSLPEYDGIIAPDAGAADRAVDIARIHRGPPLPLIVCEKEREFSTGKITRYVVPRLAPGHYLVVDDICDGGATFNILADNLPDCVTTDLWVSHGIFSKGIDALSTRYEHIYTTDSFFKGNYQHPGVSMLPLAQLYDKIMETR